MTVSVEDAPEAVTPGRGVARGQGFAAPRQNRARDRTRRPDNATAKKGHPRQDPAALPLALVPQELGYGGLEPGCVAGAG